MNILLTILLKSFHSTLDVVNRECPFKNKKQKKTLWFFCLSCLTCPWFPCDSNFLPALPSSLACWLLPLKNLSFLTFTPHAWFINLHPDTFRSVHDRNLFSQTLFKRLSFKSNQPYDISTFSQRCGRSLISFHKWHTFAALKKKPSV